MFDTITFGSATRDAFFYSENFSTHDKSLCFDLGAKIEIDKIVFTTGGGGTNTACAFSRLGFKTAIVGQIGNDVAGQAVLEDLKKDKVETKFVTQTGKFNTAYSVILSIPGKERTILVYRGASENIDENAMPWNKLKAKWFYISSVGGDFGLLEKVFAHAAKGKTKIVINPGAKELAHPEKLLPFLQRADVVLLNDSEAEKITGFSSAKMPELLNDLVKRIGGIAVVTCGEKGTWLISGKQIFQAGTLPTKVVERTGAGDAFGAGFVAGLMLKNDLAYALQLGTANATSVIQKIGAKNGLLCKKDLENIQKVKVEKIITKHN